MIERALETDTAVRSADLRGVLTFLQIRHGAWLNAASDNPHRPIYAEARDSAVREVLWRFEQVRVNAPEISRLTAEVMEIHERLAREAVRERVREAVASVLERDEALAARRDFGPLVDCLADAACEAAGLPAICPTTGERET